MRKFIAVLGRFRRALRFSSLLLAAFVIGIITFTPTQTVQATTFTVSKTVDTNDGTCNADCSLREAVVAANSAGGADNITLSVTGTYTLGSEISVTSDVTIQESGGVTAVIDGGGTTRLFNVSSTSGALMLRHHHQRAAQPARRAEHQRRDPGTASV